MAYTARTTMIDNNPRPNCLIAILEDRQSSFYQEFNVDIDYQSAIDMFLSRGRPLELELPQWHKEKITYPAHRIHYIRRA